MSKSLEYFMSHVVKTPCLPIEDWVPDNMSDCWIWQLACSNGYPVYCDRSLASHNQKASRGLWRIMRNPDLNDPKVFLCHKCPHIKCINPDHLYEGTAKQNRDDEVNRRRCRLTKLLGHEEEIVRRYKAGDEQKDIAASLGVDRITIMRYLNGQTNKSPHNYVKETEDMRNENITKLYNDGNSLTQIMAKLNIPSTVVLTVVPEIRKRRKGGLLEKANNGATNITQRNNDIRAKRAAGSSVMQLALEYNVSSPLIYHICADTPDTPAPINIST